MGLFNNSGKTNITPVQETASTAAEILPLLGLTQETIDAHQKNLLQAEAIKYGASYYKDIASMGDITSAPPVKLGEIALNPNTKSKAELPSSLQTQTSKMEAVMNPDDIKKIKMQLEGFTKGFGEAALDTKDWETAIQAYNIATEGGIIHNAEVIKKLGETYATDEETRIKIYEAISQIVGVTAKSETSASEPIKASTPTQEPTPISTPFAKTEPTPTPAPIAHLQEKPDVAHDPIPIPTPLMQQEMQRKVEEAARGVQAVQTPEAPKAPTINLAGTKPQEPITAPNGVILRPVPTPNPTTLVA
ncbi:MAG: hypothetical protein AAB512_00895 [Patescibacteria group bacterium]